MMLDFQGFFPRVNTLICESLSILLQSFYVILADEVKVRFTLMYTPPLTMK